MRRRLAGLAIASVLGVGVAGTGLGAPAALGSGVAAGHPGRWVMGYYPVYQRALMPVREIDWSAMTHLVVGAVLPRKDGTLDTSFYDDATHGPRIAQRLAAAADAHGVVPVLMVGGAGAHDGFAAAATNHRHALV